MNECRFKFSLLALRRTGFGWVCCLFASAICVWGSDGPMGVERVARVIHSQYRSKPADSDETTLWVQVDLGISWQIDRIKLLPFINWTPQSEGFPARFRIEASDDVEFKTAARIVDCTDADYADPIDAVVVFSGGGVSGRYVRLTATRLRQKHLGLAKLEIWSGGKDVAEGCSATDSVSGSLGKTALTRSPRPQGEGVVTENPTNVIPVKNWRPVPYVANAPLKEVRLHEGLLRTTMDNNVGYLLKSFSNDELLRPFRERAGLPVPEGLRKPDDFWDVSLPGSSAGRFLMGAGTSLRWMEDAELRERLEALLNGIGDCAQTNGYIMAYASNTIFYSERAAYTRSWLTHGLIEAGYAGYPKAFKMLRDYYDWFDNCAYLPELLRRGGQGVQGMIANTRMYFTPLGKPIDIQVVQRYFQENYWLDQLANREDRAIWLYPYDHPHCYLLTSIEPYLDQYRATGAKRYLDAALGGWELYHNEWEHIGGSIAICEGDTFPPYSYYLRRNTGELCGNVFWVFLNQRLQLLFPNEEKYAYEIEKSIYNVALANQSGSEGIRYTAKLVGRKDRPTAVNTCCEGQGTRLLGSLPEFVYTTTEDGFYVNQFAASTFTWKQKGESIGVEMVTGFPYKPEVEMRMLVRQPMKSKMHIRVPSWASKDMPILVNGKKVAVGKPGTFVELDQKWNSRDRITFTLPMDLKLTQYEGIEQVEGEDRYALEYGPILMAMVGPVDEKQGARILAQPDDLTKILKAKPDRPLHFEIEGDTEHEYIPYWEVQDQSFTCFPVIGTGRVYPRTVSPFDLALAKDGATVTSDSEYAREPGCVANVIDGVIARPSDFSNRWHSSIETPHPHWIEVKLARPATIGTVIIRFADLEGYPTSFKGVARVKGKEMVLFDVAKQRRARFFEAKIKPVTTDTFRLEIRSSANPNYLNAAQISEIELYPPGK